MKSRNEIGCLHLEIQNRESLQILQINSPLSGLYQTLNITGVLAIVVMLNRKFDFNISQENIVLGIQNIIQNMQFYGRWQVLSKEPLTILDVAHNPDGIVALRKTLATFTYKKLHWIIGMVKDKDIDTVLQYLPEDTCYYCITPPIPRGLEAEILCDKIKEKHFEAAPFLSAKKAYNQVLKNFKAGDLILIAGSCFIMEPFLKQKQS